MRATLCFVLFAVITWVCLFLELASLDIALGHNMPLVAMLLFSIIISGPMTVLYITPYLLMQIFLRWIAKRKIGKRNQTITVALYYLLVDLSASTVFSIFAQRIYLDREGAQMPFALVALFFSLLLAAPAICGGVLSQRIASRKAA